jgi:hypothetical protein
MRWNAKVVQELLRHASFKTTMDGYTQALEQPKRQTQEQLADLIMRTGTVGHATNNDSLPPWVAGIDTVHPIVLVMSQLPTLTWRKS